MKKMTLSVVLCFMLFSCKKQNPSVADAPTVGSLTYSIAGYYPNIIIHQVAYGGAQPADSSYTSEVTLARVSDSVIHIDLMGYHVEATFNHFWGTYPNYDAITYGSAAYFGSGTYPELTYNRVTDSLSIQIKSGGLGGGYNYYAVWKK